MAALQPVVGVSVAPVVEVEEAELTTVSTQTPACRTCSRALSKNTWTRFMSGPVKCPGAEQDMDHRIPTLTHMHTHIPTLKGSHRLT